MLLLPLFQGMFNAKMSVSVILGTGTNCAFVFNSSLISSDWKNTPISDSFYTRADINHKFDKFALEAITSGMFISDIINTRINSFIKNEKLDFVNGIYISGNKIMDSGNGILDSRNDKFVSGNVKKNDESLDIKKINEIFDSNKKLKVMNKLFTTLSRTIRLGHLKYFQF